MNTWVHRAKRSLIVDHDGNLSKAKKEALRNGCDYVSSF